MNDLGTWFEYLRQDLFRHRTDVERYFFIIILITVHKLFIHACFHIFHL